MKTFTKRSHAFKILVLWVPYIHKPQEDLQPHEEMEHGMSAVLADNEHVYHAVNSWLPTLAGA